MQPNPATAIERLRGKRLFVAAVALFLAIALFFSLALAVTSSPAGELDSSGDTSTVLAGASWSRMMSMYDGGFDTLGASWS